MKGATGRAGLPDTTIFPGPPPSKKATKINHSTSTLSFLVPGFINAALTEEDPLVQIDIDDSRHILYTRSEKGTIQVFDLGSDGQQLTKIAALSQATIG